MKLENLDVVCLIAGSVFYLVGVVKGAVGIMFAIPETTDIFGIYFPIAIGSSGVFFFMVGAGIAYIIKKRSLKKNWIIMSIIFYVLSLIMSLIYIRDAPFEILHFFIFPAYASIVAATLGVQEVLARLGQEFSDKGEVLLLIVFNSAFFMWVYLEFMAKRYKHIRFVLLVFIFVVMLVGVKSCMIEFAN